MIFLLKIEHYYLCSLINLFLHRYHVAGSIQQPYLVRILYQDCLYMVSGIIIHVHGRVENLFICRVYFHKMHYVLNSCLCYRGFRLCMTKYLIFIYITAGLMQCIHFFFPFYKSDGNVFTWGWGGSNGTFSDDGHSSGGQLVSF